MNLCHIFLREVMSVNYLSINLAKGIVIIDHNYLEVNESRACKHKGKERKTHGLQY